MKRNRINTEPPRSSEMKRSRKQLRTKTWKWPVGGEEAEQQIKDHFSRRPDPEDASSCACPPHTPQKS